MELDQFRSEEKKEETRSEKRSEKERRVVFGSEGE